MANLTLMNTASLERALARVAHEIAERNERGADVVLVGIQRGGIHLAQRLGRLLEGIWGQAVPVGELDVTMHRDDLDRGLPGTVHPTRIPFDVSGRTVVLVDDVLFSGRTTRAAMDALNDFGRPRRIQLAVLVDRGQRELPIVPDFVGRAYSATGEDWVRVRLKEEGGDDVVEVGRREEAA